jgi:Mrp family chromosome partitioning ATPase
MRPPFAFPSGVAPNTNTPRTAFSTDARRAIPRHVWLQNRARNALQRPAFIGVISVGTFVTAIVSMIVVPRAQRQPPPVVRPAPRPDTLSMIAAAAVAQTQILQADSELVAARRTLTPSAPAATPATADSSTTVSTRDSTRVGMLDSTAIPDSSLLRARALDRLISRAQQAPLLASYKALADAPELRGDARVRALVDSLTEIEREREGFGAVGGVDPIFVALTSRASEIGRTIQAIAVSRRAALLATTRRAADTVTTPAVAVAPAIDTMGLIARRDSARLAFQQANDSLLQRRQVALALDREEALARERATAVAPPLALLASAFVLSAVIGFAGALTGELRRPRVSDASELERLLGTRVLATVERSMPTTERGRREADRAAPPYLDPGAEAYQLAYLGLATEHPTLLAATVTGDEPAVSAVVAANLAAVAADEARNSLLLDLDPSNLVAAAVRVRRDPGVADLVDGSSGWPDVTVAARVGRDKSIDVIPFGIGSVPNVQALRDLLVRDGSRVARYYDAAFAVVSTEQARSELVPALPSAEVVYCARPGFTSLRYLTEQLDAIRTAGTRVRGVVLWNAERPMLPAQDRPKAPQSRARGPQPALAGS